LKTNKRKFICYLLLPRFGAILGGSIYFWGGVFYALAITRHFSFYDLALAWFCGEFLINQAKYWLNDYKDLVSDRFHPRKKERASAGGIISARWLPVLFACRTAAGLVLLFLFLPKVLPFALLLPLVQFLYENVKRIPLLNAGIAASGALVRFAIGFCAGAGGWPALLPCLLVYAQRMAIYFVAYAAEGRYLMQRRPVPGKEYTLFYARRPYLEKLSLVCFLGLLGYAIAQSAPVWVALAGVAIAAGGILYYRVNGPGDKFYFYYWKFLWLTFIFTLRKKTRGTGVKIKGARPEMNQK